MKDKFNYEAMSVAPLDEMRALLAQLKSNIEDRITKALDGVTNPTFVKNSGAVDRIFINDKRRREVYFSECEKIVKELNALGHMLVPLDIDSDTDFEKTSISWATDWQDKARGLDIEFFPSNTNILWVVSPKA